MARHNKQDEPLTGLLKNMQWSKADFSSRYGVSLATVKRWCQPENVTPGKKMAVALLEILVNITNAKGEPPP